MVETETDILVGDLHGILGTVPNAAGTVPEIWSEHKQRGTQEYTTRRQFSQPVLVPKAGCRQMSEALTKVAGGPRVAAISKRT
jgi:hypothetical protein